MKRNNRNIFGLFVFWNAAIKGKQLKRKKERKLQHGYTKYRQDMICK
jgi:hypothetical protein